MADVASDAVFSSAVAPAPASLWASDWRAGAGAAWEEPPPGPLAFRALCERRPNVKIWLSGHFHLSHSYPESVSAGAGACTFVQTGVIGNCNRDGERQSRVLDLDESGFRVWTCDHGSGGRLRLDAEGAWTDPVGAASLVPEEDRLCDPELPWLCGALSCDVLGSIDEEAALGSAVVGKPQPRWFSAGGDAVLCQTGDGLLVEWSARAQAPVGLVSRDASTDDRVVELVGPDGASPCDPTGDGSDAAFVVVRCAKTGDALERVGRNGRGSFYRVYQQNKWALKAGAVPTLEAQGA